MANKGTRYYTPGYDDLLDTMHHLNHHMGVIDSLKIEDWDVFNYDKFNDDWIDTANRVNDLLDNLKQKLVDEFDKIQREFDEYVGNGTYEND